MLPLSLDVFLIFLHRYRDIAEPINVKFCCLLVGSSKVSELFVEIPFYRVLSYRFLLAFLLFEFLECFSGVVIDRDIILGNVVVTVGQIDEFIDSVLFVVYVGLAAKALLVILVFALLISW